MYNDGRVFFGSGVAALAFVLAAVLLTGPVGRTFAAVQDWIVTQFGWFLSSPSRRSSPFALWRLVSRHGAVRLGGDDEPEFSYPAWFSMLFSAGTGIGLLFCGVAEPVLHFAEPRVGTVPPATAEAAKEAVDRAYFHWGLHAWAVYVVVAVGLVNFGCRHDLRLTIGSTLYPLLGRRVHGPVGDAVDSMAVFGTLSGVATSLGLGVRQINAGRTYNGRLGISMGNQLLLIAVIIAATTISVCSGLGRGLRRLSEANVLLDVLLLAFVFFPEPSVFLLGAYVESSGHYLQTLLDASFRTTPYRGVEWQQAWTMYYWGWWISWAPFVGMFIARVSCGRTIREFVAGVLLVPVAFTFFWFTEMGNTALHVELYGDGGMVKAVQDNVSTALLVMLDSLPWAAISSVIAALMVATFFVTSADRCALLIDIICSRGRTDASAWQRVFWALAIGAVAALLPLAGGLNALPAAAIITALPFALIMLAIAASFLKSLRAEATAPAPAAEAAPQIVLADGVSTHPWRAELAQTLDHAQATVEERSPRRAAADSVQNVVLPAFDELRAERKRHGREARIDRSNSGRMHCAAERSHGIASNLASALRRTRMPQAHRLAPGLQRRDDRFAGEVHGRSTVVPARSA